ncbi:MAG TPA: CHC2 zinc finger domain-containing protein [Candidatus Hydrogenedentes bacterium]|nr:MAG: CHC2 zinc finger protein [Candidatus Hydrogenedentes bacterium ADurb.Bin179]HOH28324.1 CHC2 zinc finger domain-containing protein [Candidatus Hydrogenedentota bacterium]
MQNRYSKQCLWNLRNLIPIAMLIADILELPHKISDGYFRFQCPLCKNFDTATNPKTNLARCFACKRNFNTIDLVMMEKRLNFKDAVRYLQTIRKVDTKQLCAELAKKLSADASPAK